LARENHAAFLANALGHPDFVAGNVDTGFIETHLEALIGAAGASPKVLEAAAAARLTAYNIPTPLTGFRLNAPARVEMRLQLDADILDVRLTRLCGALACRTSPLPK
jgi:3-methylcrotonyl-CoA carboxylase alpha subunit